MNTTVTDPFAQWDATAYKPAKKPEVITDEAAPVTQEEPKKETPPQDETTDTSQAGTEEVTEAEATTEEPAEDADWKKRYADLRSHLNDKTSEIKELRTKVKELETKPDITKLATDEDLAEFEKASPEVYSVLQAIALKTNKDIKDELEELKKDRTVAAQEKAFSEILKSHPDADAIRKSPEFAAWYNLQTRAIQGLLSSETPIDAIRGLDMYKAELKKQETATKKSPAKTDASLAVAAGKGSKALTQDTRKIWKESEIRDLSVHAYAKAKDDIKLAQQQGRVIFDLQ